ncbi:GNAT family N-acetyltransferase [Vibrio gallicus]|uniref:GNAT family N-acetyltransferase n=1 Tax=Vibrio gallicus TaxID=190897 RepID=UPI0021C32AD4|nr:GNAT family N-acetyltransferase [Vibrio gallicus]
MTVIRFYEGQLSDDIQQTVSAGFERHSQLQHAPEYVQRHIHWQAFDDNGDFIGIVTGKCLWDWLYIDELWVDDGCRGTGLGKALIETAQHYAKTHKFTGLWLWTQSWQAPRFYEQLGFEEFTRFEDFPKGHSRIGLRKYLNSVQ